MDTDKQYSNQDDQLLVELGRLIKKFPAKSISLICISIAFIFGSAWQLEKEWFSVNKVREENAIKAAYIKHKIDIPKSSDIVQLIQHFSLKIEAKYNNASIPDPQKRNPTKATTINAEPVDNPVKKNTHKSGLDGIRTRIVVLPFYVEQGNEVDTGDNELGGHYRRMSGFIVNHLVKNNFEVVNPFAKESAEKDLNLIMERAREDSMLVAKDMCTRYGVDAVYIVWLKVKTKETSDGYFKATAFVDGEGYDSAGRSLGANISKTFTITRSDFDDAVRMVEKEVGDIVGIALTNWRLGLSKTIENNAKYISISLHQANEYELVEVFGKVLISVKGVLEANQLSMRIVPDNPQASSVEWMVEIDPDITDSFRLQTNIMKIINDVIDTGGTVQIKGVDYRYTQTEMRFMKGLRPGKASSRSIIFLIDRERARERDFSFRFEPDDGTKNSLNWI
ncbi:MAG: hypothetical protein GY860_14825 [Desulfobacteraceae bacterium]|nr:hypothetical protein [Desulfobacteraceae bacterium]